MIAACSVVRHSTCLFCDVPIRCNVASRSWIKKGTFSKNSSDPLPLFCYGFFQIWKCCSLYLRFCIRNKIYRFFFCFYSACIQNVFQLKLNFITIINLGSSFEILSRHFKVSVKLKSCYRMLSIGMLHLQYVIGIQKTEFPCDT